MAVSIDFKEHELNDLIEMYLSRIKEKKGAVAELEREIKGLNAKVTQFRLAQKNANYAGQIEPIPGEKVYSNRWTWVQKIAFAIELEKRPLTANEVFEFLVTFEPEFKNERRKTVGSISGTLSIKSGSYEEKKDFVRIDGGGEFIYQNYEDYTLPIEQTQLFGNRITVDDTPDWLK